ncbi:YifB family Mg chelatase-like AAA ATPase [Leucobacter sp. UT-8R-CII-1-4]|uniref:YifB family Mg chelatase-like AAA ATPase n=1 Tax=Leucobacter sp. UT-8R-CII-1-4 TaxID=3040075 RepID=UPI0032BF9F45
MSDMACRASAIALTGLDGTVVQVEAAASNQLPGMAIIGLPDASLTEAKLRVRQAAQQVGLALTDRFLVVNLSPAALPKHGSGFDLAIALASLAASKQMPSDRLTSVAHIGELGLDGGLRRPPGLLSAVLAARRHGFSTVMVPAVCAQEAALVPNITVVAAETLRDAVDWYRGVVGNWHIAQPGSAKEGTETDAATTKQSFADPDIAEVIGQPEAVEALIIAAAGRHHLSMIGPPGAGKTLLATRLASILPDLSDEESITASSIASLGGSTLTELVRRPPFESPHHTASAVSIIGGGDSSGVRPGAVTKACHGVLFLDEAPEFPRGVLDALRQPLETGTVEIHRAKVRTTLPAHAQLVLAANPCPCGNAGTVNAEDPCRCTPSQRVRYLGRLSGPLTDRIDLRINIRRVSSVLLDGDVVPTITSEEARKRVLHARKRASARLNGTPWRVNGEVRGEWLRAPANRLPRAATAVIDAALARGSLTVRGYDRVLRLAWTLADLAEKTAPDRAELRHALALRGGAAL